MDVWRKHGNNLSQRSTKMKYKGFNIGKVSKYIFHRFDDSEGYYWNVNHNYQNVHFDTLKEAKYFINSKLKTV